MNYFALFSIPEQFDISQEVIRQRYEMLQRITHPDKYSSEQDKRMYIQKNAQVNDAYHVFQSPVLRGEHLLEVRGVELPSQQATISDTEFLMQQMDLREALTSAENETEFSLLEWRLIEMEADYIDRINILLNKNDVQSNNAAGLELNKLKFLKKLMYEVTSRKHSVLNR